MKKLKYGLVLGALCLLGASGFSQEGCASLQCDCANLEGTADAGALALCKYYEKAMKESCAEGGDDCARPIPARPSSDLHAGEERTSLLR